jgi:hypothetical protein
MTFEVMIIPGIKAKRRLKAEFQFDAMKANPGSGFVIPAENSDLFGLARTRTSLYNKANGTRFTCNKLNDGSLRVWNSGASRPLPTIQNDVANRLQQSTNEIVQTEMIPERDVKPKEHVPNKQQFVDYLKSLTPGVSIKLGQEYVYRFAEFELWALELDGFDTAINYNPPELKITRKG